MLIFIICLIIFLGSIGLCIWGKSANYPFCEEVMNLVSGLLIAIFGIAVITMSSVFIVNVSCEDYKSELFESKYESLMLRLEKAEEQSEDASFVELNGLYEDIYEYNMEVKGYKYWGNNIWTNWFYVKKIVRESKYIEIKN